MPHLTQEHTKSPSIKGHFYLHLSKSGLKRLVGLAEAKKQTPKQTGIDRNELSATMAPENLAP
jgi:hypothetical protein